MNPANVFRGTLDEINTRYGRMLAGRILNVMVDQDGQEATYETGKPFYETATPEQWSSAWRDWADNRDPNTPILSDAAIDRTSIYEGRG